MSDTEKKSTQRDAGLAADQRPVPSQAEGDRETIEEDLNEKDQEKTSPDRTR